MTANNNNNNNNGNNNNSSSGNSNNNYNSNGDRISGQDLQTWLLAYEHSIDVYICANKFLLDGFKQAIARVCIDSKCNFLGVEKRRGGETSPFFTVSSQVLPHPLTQPIHPSPRKERIKKKQKNSDS